jgi:hypothetical protein
MEGRASGRLDGGLHGRERVRVGRDVGGARGRSGFEMDFTGGASAAANSNLERQVDTRRNFVL